MVAGERSQSLGICLRWLPVWLPKIWLASLIKIIRQTALRDAGVFLLLPSPGPSSGARACRVENVVAPAGDITILTSLAGRHVRNAS